MLADFPFPNPDDGHSHHRRQTSQMDSQRLKSSRYEPKTPPAAGTGFRDTVDSRGSATMTGFGSLFFWGTGF